MTSDLGSETTNSVTLRNNSKQRMTLCLEPWGEAYVFRPADGFVVVSTGTSDPVDVEFTRTSIIVWAGNGGMLQLFHEGIEVGSVAHRFRTYYSE